MNERTKNINKFLLEQLKEGKIDKDIVYSILKEINQKTVSRKDIAIIGISGRFPGANNIDEFWENLKNEIICTGHINNTRYNDMLNFNNSEIDNIKNSKIPIGFLNDIDKFDASFFNISPLEAKCMDPGQRILLENVCQAINDAGYNFKNLNNSNTGVFLGMDNVTKINFSDKLKKEHGMLAQIGSMTSIYSSRISYFFNLIGPNYTIDTACSSSLVALHLAVKSLRNNECKLAIVNGLSLLANIMEGFESVDSKDGFLSAFDMNASGTLWAETVCSLILKPLDTAIEDNDNIYAIIKGTAVNNDGTSNGITAPRSETQTKVILDAWKDANINPENISYIEAHGTGTLIGDPIEIKGIKDAFERFTKRKQFCGLGSVKTNIGHAAGASGLVSLVKVILSMKHRIIPSTLNFNIPNKFINFYDTPIYINNKLKKWKSENTPRLAAINSFGFSRTNCHVVLQEFEKENDVSADLFPFFILTISAKNIEVLRKIIQKYLFFLLKTSHINIQDFCFTANTGMNNYAHRAAVIFKDYDDLIEKLIKLLNIDFISNNDEDIYYGFVKIRSHLKEAKRNDEITLGDQIDFRNHIIENIDLLIQNKNIDNLKNIASLYISGGNIDWTKFYQNNTYNRISLPVYPFKKVRYWIDNIKSESDLIDNNHLIHKNHSDKLRKRQNISDWLYEPFWEKSKLIIKKNTSNINNFIVFINDCNFGKRVIDELKKNQYNFIKISQGDSYCKLDDDSYSIKADSFEDYLKLFRELKELDFQNYKVIHLWNFSDNKKSDISKKNISEVISCGFYSLCNLAKAYNNISSDKNLDLYIISNNLEKIFDDDVIYPEKSIVLGPCKVIHKEYKNITCRSIDINLSKDLTIVFSDELIKQVISEIKYQGKKDFRIAFRDNTRFIESFKKIDPDIYIKKINRANDGKTYLITGGLGDIGFEISKYLSETYKSNLVLIGQTKLPEKREWEKWENGNNNKITQKIQRIKILESFGSKVIYYSCDISNESEMQKKISEAEQEFDQINGVIHSAGIVDGGLIELRKRDLSENVFKSKIYGTIVLNSIFKGTNLDFFICFSSISSIIPYIGQVAYCTSNCFLDSFSISNRSKNYISINWDSWKEIGMTVKNIKNFSQNKNLSLDNSINVKEGISVFKKIINYLEFPQVIISTTDLLKNYDDWKTTGRVAEYEDVIDDDKDLFDSFKFGYDLEQKISMLLKKTLEIDLLDVNSNYLELGMNSLTLLQFNKKLKKYLNINISIDKLFANPTVISLTKYLKKSVLFEDKYENTGNKKNKTEKKSSKIAIIGMSGRFPGANNIEQFWDNIKNGRESISFFSEEELIESGLDEELVIRKDFIKAKGIVDEVEFFDSDLFKYTPQEAEIMDPQVRIFHECCWEALEDSGYNPENAKQKIGLFAGGSQNFRWENIGLSYFKDNPAEQFEYYQFLDKDFLSTKVSYCLNLNGPSMSIQSACSTSLAAVHQACNALNNNDCDIALAGGVSIRVPVKNGYIYQGSMINSKDGHNRAFDENASGTVFSDGAGVVVLKRLDDAVADGDQIYAVIKGSAINNDGKDKIGYTAPGINGQSEVIKSALDTSDTAAEDITYIEAHGTATELGDIIEIQALKQAFDTQEKQFCAIGTIKNNIGHIDAASGVAGLIKTALSIRYNKIPPCINFTNPNPKINFKNTPFYVNTELKEWNTGNKPKLAGVSSFGIGGTNIHLILEDAPKLRKSGNSRNYHLAVISAKNEASLNKLEVNLFKFLNKNPGINIPDLCFTLQVGRKVLDYKKVFICADTNDLINGLNRKVNNSFKNISKNIDKQIIFMFPGQGSQYLKMGYDLYISESYFREQMDLCFNILKEILDYDIKECLYPKNTEDDKNNKLDDSQILLFVIEYSLAKLLMYWGIRPSAMIGHSTGEYTAACLSGVFKLKDALWIISERSKLIQSMPGGRMLGVPLSEEDLKPYINETISISAINSPDICIVSGPNEIIDQFKQKLKKLRIISTELASTHAAHSYMIDPILNEFETTLSKIEFHSPDIPFISNLTGDWIKQDEVLCPEYWVNHLRNTVRFSDGIKKLIENGKKIFIEVGPGKVLSSLCFENDKRQFSGNRYLNIMRHEEELNDDFYVLLSAVGRLWLDGISINWDNFYINEERNRIILPKYPFERKRHWKLLDQSRGILNNFLVDNNKKLLKNNISDCFYIPVWKYSKNLKKANKIDQKTTILILYNEYSNIGIALSDKIREKDYNSIFIKIGTNYNKIDNNNFIINPINENEITKIIDEILLQGIISLKIVHICNILDSFNNNLSIVDIDKVRKSGYENLLLIAKVFGSHKKIKDLELFIISNNIYNVTGSEKIYPQNAILLGPCYVIPQEYPNIKCKYIDIDIAEYTNMENELLIENLMLEIEEKDFGAKISYRNGYRWELNYELVKLPENKKHLLKLKMNGVYVITGGLGSVGLKFAEYFAKKLKAKLILIGRSIFPDKSKWDEILQNNNNDDLIVKKIKKLKELEDFGAEIFVYSTDVSNENQMENTILEVEEQCGKINGVIHAAGNLGQNDFKMIKEINEIDTTRQFNSKVYALIILEKIFNNRNIDFCLLMSSLSSILGGIGYTSYASANIFMDSFINYNKKINWLCINWDNWEGGRINVVDKAGENIESDIDQKQLLTQSTGLRAFELIVGQNHYNQVIVSLFDLHDKIDKWVCLKSFKEINNDNEKYTETSKRPDVFNEYVEATNDIEISIVNIWKKLFGYGKIGITDNFIDLGGNSLKAINLVTILNNKFDINITLSDIFNNSNIKQIAEIITKSDSVKNKLPVVNHDLKSKYLPFDLTDVQQAYFVGRNKAFELGNIATHAYNEFYLSNFDPDKFNIALKKVIDRHDMLKAIILQTGKQQILKEIPEYKLKILDLKDRSTADIDYEIEKIRGEMSHHVFKIDEWPLFEFRITILNNNKICLHSSIDLLITDALSIRILFNDLFRFYNTPNLSINPFQLSFRDYVLTEQKLENTELYKKSELYWKEKIGSLPSAPELPLKQEPEMIKKPEFKRWSFQLNEKMWKKLKEYSRQINVTENVILLTAFADVLRLFSKKSCFSINLTFFNRLPLHPEVNEIIGDFTSLILLGIKDIYNNSFENRTREIQKKLWENIDHRYFSGVKVIREINKLLKNKNMKALMPIVFTSTLGLDVENNEESSENDLNISLDENDLYSISQTPQVWLDNQISEVGNKLEINWDVVAELFPDGFIDEMFNTYCNILNELVNNKNSWLKVFPYIQDMEKNSEVFIKLDTNKIDNNLLLSSLFTQKLKQFPENTAVKSGEITLTYNELDYLSNNLAYNLIQKDVKPNELVAIVMEKGWEQIAGALGIIKSGAAYLPIDINIPPERLNYLLENGKVKIVIIQKKYKNLVDLNDKFKKVILDIDLLKQAKKNIPEKIQSSTDLAYVIYTSGSTGKPKGVMIDNRGAVNTILDINERFKVNEKDKVIGLSSMSFDLSVYDVFGMLASGGTIVLPDENELRNPEYWSQLVKKEKISIWNTVPAFVKMYVEYLEGTGERIPDSLRLILMSGDWIPIDLPDRIRQLSKDVSIISLGGATEASIWSIIYPIEKINTEWKSIPYGKALKNQAFYVLNDKYLPCPTWVPGDLYIGGIGLAKGYWADEEKTKTSFIRHPITKEKLYKTGDIGRYFPDGNIEFLGREDYQVKIQGFRIELGEIENVLKQHDKIKESVVNVYEDKSGRQLIGYIVKEDDELVNDDLNDYKNFLTNPIERIEFKLSQKGYREINNYINKVKLIQNGNNEIKLFDGKIGKIELYEGSVSLEEVSSIFFSLSSIVIDYSPLPKFYYPSAGSLFPVQLYLYLPDGFIDSIDSGYYYYDRKNHELILLQKKQDNKKHYAELFFIGDNNAIFPIYGPAAKDFCLIETGHMINLITKSAYLYDIGLKKITENDDNLFDYLCLDDNYELITTYQIGRITKKAKNKDNIQNINIFERQSYRQFQGDRLDKNRFNSFLINILENYYLDEDNQDLKIYIYIKNGAINEYLGGYYKYNRKNKKIELVNENKIFDKKLFKGMNRKIYFRSDFSIFLVAKNETAQNFKKKEKLKSLGIDNNNILIDSGDLGQDLMLCSLKENIGLCPIGFIDSDSLRDVLNLSKNEIIIYSFLGGSISQSQKLSLALESYESNTEEFNLELINYLKQFLPDYMIPRNFIIIDRLPLTSNGKVDRKSLPVPDVKTNLKKDYEPARNNTEEKLVDIWQEILNIKRIGITDNFFDLGGNSLQAIQVVTKANLEKINITVNYILTYQNIKNIIEHVEVNSNNDLFDNYEDDEEESMLF